MTYSKYNNLRMKLDGHKFDSKKEMRRYKELKLMERAGKIKDLELQPKFRLIDGFKYRGEHQRAVNYFADFKYYDIEKDKWIVEDVKGYKTSVYKLKKKMLLRQLKDKEDIVFKEISRRITK